MSLGTWLKSLFTRTRTRDVSRLQPAPGGVGAIAGEVDEVVSLSGGPLKEHHHRRALRDKRLLPKPKSPARQFGLVKRKKVMEKTEAERLFGGTMRTRNRNLRDLLPDEDQLERYGLPVWRSEEDVARALGISLKQLWYFSIHRERERQPHYITFAIPKRSGGKRLIMAPKRRLKAIQRQLMELLVENLPVSEHAHGFRKGRNVRTGAEAHVGKRFVLKMDLKDFFPCVTAARVRGLLVSYGYGFPVATTLAVLMTEAERQPVEIDGQVFHVPVGNRHCVQGAPTSPGLCNAMLLKLDRRLGGLAKKKGVNYTRYADDLTFSGDIDRAAANAIHGAVHQVVMDEGFEINSAKTRLMGRAARQVVTGVVVNQVLGLSREERRRLRAMAHRIKKDAIAGEVSNLQARFKGKVAYLSMLNPQQASKFATRV
jgi:RNA-directed DNA polymerase